MPDTVKIRWSDQAATVVMSTGTFVNRSHAEAVWGRLTGKTKGCPANVELIRKGK